MCCKITVLVLDTLQELYSFGQSLCQKTPLLTFDIKVEFSRNLSEFTEIHGDVALD